MSIKNALVTLLLFLIFSSAAIAADETLFNSAPALSDNGYLEIAKNTDDETSILLHIPSIKDNGEFKTGWVREIRESDGSTMRLSLYAANKKQSRIRIIASTLYDNRENILAQNTLGELGWISCAPPYVYPTDLEGIIWLCIVDDNALKKAQEIIKIYEQTPSIFDEIGLEKPW